MRPAGNSRWEARPSHAEVERNNRRLVQGGESDAASLVERLRRRGTGPAGGHRDAGRHGHRRALGGPFGAFASSGWMPGHSKNPLRVSAPRSEARSCTRPCTMSGARSAHAARASVKWLRFMTRPMKLSRRGLWQFRRADIQASRQVSDKAVNGHLARLPQFYGFLRLFGAGNACVSISCTAG